MSTQWQADELVRVGSVAPVAYKRSYLKLAVCELRFPTLFALEEQRPPHSMHQLLRKAYPIYNRMSEVMVGLGNSSTSNGLHSFKSSSGNWTITLKTSSVAIETTTYPGFEGMQERIRQMLDAVVPVIDTDTLTRVGLRYVNVIRPEGLEMGAWINPALVGPLMTGRFTGIGEYSGRLVMQMEDGGCNFNHGVQIDPAKQQLNKEALPDYVVDVDAYRNNVSLQDVNLAVTRAHDQARALFDWALGPAGRQHLSGE